MATEFTEKNFEQEVLGSDKPALVDFWAPWCGPCQIMGPIIDEISKELGGDFKIGKMNVDENPEISQKYNIMSIPTIMIFEKGNVVNQLMGVQAKETLIAELKKLSKK